MKKKVRNEERKEEVKKEISIPLLRSDGGWGLSYFFTLSILHKVSKPHEEGKCWICNLSVFNNFWWQRFACFTANVTHKGMQFTWHSICCFLAFYLGYILGSSIKVIIKISCSAIFLVILFLKIFQTKILQIFKSISNFNDE